MRLFVRIRLELLHRYTSTSPIRGYRDSCAVNHSILNECVRHSRLPHFLSETCETYIRPEQFAYLCTHFFVLQSQNQHQSCFCKITITRLILIFNNFKFKRTRCTRCILVISLEISEKTWQRNLVCKLYWPVATWFIFANYLTRMWRCILRPRWEFRAYPRELIVEIRNITVNVYLHNHKIILVYSNFRDFVHGILNEPQEMCQNEDPRDGKI